MIRNLILKNWRSYEDASIGFKPGTTFVVASNGIGKTSLVEAVRWALFGKIEGNGHAAVRVGAEVATAEVELELPDGKVLSVERSIDPKVRGIPGPTVRSDGHTLTDEDFGRRLNDAYRTDPAFLAGLTMPGLGRDPAAPTTLGLAEHLGRYYGIDGLKGAADRLGVLLKETQAGIRRIKVGNAATAKQLEELRETLEDAAGKVSVAVTKHEILQARLVRAQERERFESALHRWQESRDAWAEGAAELARTASREIGRDVPVEDVEDTVEHHVGDLTQQLETVRVEIGVSQSSLSTLTGNDARLSAAHDDCPVCRRPLDEAAIEAAHQANQQEIELVRSSIQELEAKAGTLGAQRDRLVAVREAWRKLPRPGERPTPPEDEDEQVASALLAAKVAEAFEIVVKARTAHARAEEKLAEAEGADQAMRDLGRLFRREAVLTVAVNTTTATLNNLLAETVLPLAGEVNQRWKTLFPGRGDVATDASGDMTRSIQGHSLPFGSFSTGESMGATILIRLLAAQMATKADFCWFDEPLEHLDPDVRRRVANILSRATSGEGQLRQVVVTTYEEQLARHLRARDEERIHLIDVRPAT
ncbi:AAA family ATPase [Amycolatopsis australiensis]|uniref:Nuclease SbcCD subunit C n=1 Tax=Amycolatopsis australiensis TaxID=546364 RepID=A0A1K1RRV5_9PSEU|nr:AAA family ATPase [Amycolatopsis australiensis]SFW75019.1 AAA domain-containing protein [Amycolatopsis australiensis]